MKTGFPSTAQAREASKVFSPPRGVWQELIFSVVNDFFLADKFDFLSNFTRVYMMGSQSFCMSYADNGRRVSVVCTFQQGGCLPAGSWRRSSASARWRRHDLELDIVLLRILCCLSHMVFESCTAFVVSS